MENVNLNGLDTSYTPNPVFGLLVNCWVIPTVEEDSLACASRPLFSAVKVKPFGCCFLVAEQHSNFVLLKPLLYNTCVGGFAVNDLCSVAEFSEQLLEVM